jgi:threonyl-tRNA synthetase
VIIGTGGRADLFSFPDEIGQDSHFPLPRAAPIRRLMETTPAASRGIRPEFVNPHITKSQLFEISGHLDWFADSMYPPMELSDGASTTTSSR